MTMLQIEWDWEDVARVLGEEVRVHLLYPGSDELAVDRAMVTEDDLEEISTRVAGEVLHELLVQATVERVRAEILAGRNT